MIHIALDLELEQPNTNPQTPDSKIDHEKIIQIGWVVFESNPFNILEKSMYHVQYDKGLSSFIQTLTGIKDEDVMNGYSLEYIYDKLVESQTKFNTSRVVKQWGGGDMGCLQKELPSSIDWKFGYSGFNVKHLYQSYADATGLNTSGGLKKSMGRVGLQFSNVDGKKAHNALTDAYNTAIMYSHLIGKFNA